MVTRRAKRGASFGGAGEGASRIRKVTSCTKHDFTWREA
jgi:hypothetical protein